MPQTREKFVSSMREWSRVHVLSANTDNTSLLRCDRRWSRDIKHVVREYLSS